MVALEALRIDENGRVYVNLAVQCVDDEVDVLSAFSHPDMEFIFNREDLTREDTNGESKGPSDDAPDECTTDTAAGQRCNYPGRCPYSGASDPWDSAPGQCHLWGGGR